MQKKSFPWLGTGIGGALGTAAGLGVGHTLGSKGKGLILPAIIGAASGAGLGGLLHSGISDTIAENKAFEHDKAIVEEWLKQNPDKRIRPDYTLVTPQMMHGDHFNKYMTSNVDNPTGQYAMGSVLSSWDYERAKKQAEWQAYKQMLQLMGQQKQASIVTEKLDESGFNPLTGVAGTLIGAYLARGKKFPARALPILGSTAIAGYAPKMLGMSSPYEHTFTISPDFQFEGEDGGGFIAPKNFNAGRILEV
jgi:hypothetical protein